MTTSEKRKIVFAGIDDGFDETKIILSNNNKIKIKSQAKAGELNQINVSGHNKTVFNYKTNNGLFSIGDIRESDSTSFDEYPTSPLNRVIVSHAIRQMNINNNDSLVICTGLPVNRFYVRNKINQSLVKAKRKNLLLNDVIPDDGTLLPKIIRHEVLTEAIAAWFDLVIERNNDGKLIKNSDISSQTTAIIDIGGRTTDVAVLSGGILDKDRSGTIDVGMLAVRQNVNDKIADEFDGVEPTTIQLNEAFNSGKIKMWGQYHDISSLIEESKKTIVSRIESDVKKRLGKGSDIDNIVFVGGTVIAIEPYLDNWFRQQIIADNPSYANASGMCKYAEMMLSKP